MNPTSGKKLTKDIKIQGGVSSVSHPLAASASAIQYSEGGNAIDAAIAAAFSLTVVEPHHSGIAGQAHILIRDGANRKITAFDSYSAAPLAASETMYKWIPSPTQGDYRFYSVDNANTIGFLSVGVPAALLGWLDIHRRHGILPLSRVLQPAINYAKYGFIIDNRLAEAINEHKDKLIRFPASRYIWFDDELNPLEEGDLLIQEDLSRSIEMIATEQEEVFYRGEIGQAICEEMKMNGGIITQDDLEEAYDLLRIRPPIEFEVSGWNLYGSPPPTTGGILVPLTLGILKNMGLNTQDNFIVYMVETLRLAFNLRTKILGNGDIDQEEIERLLAPEFIEQCGVEISRKVKEKSISQKNNRDYANHTSFPEEETTHHSHLDSDGNCVACTQSLGDKFGSGITLHNYGLLLNNAMKLFDPRSKMPNSIQPFRKMLSSMAPTILTNGEGEIIGLGSPSGTRIISAITQTIINHIWRAESLFEAIVHPRIHISGNNLEAEFDLPEEEKEILLSYCYEVDYYDSLNDWFGAVQAVKCDRNSFLFGAADPRRNGAVFVNQKAIKLNKTTK